MNNCEVLMIHWYILYIFFLLIFLEIGFRIYYKKKYGRNYHVSLKFPWDESYIVSHPYLSFAYRRNSWIDLNQLLDYPIHTNKYYSFKNPIRINNMGHFGKDFSSEKSANILRIVCLGHSTTANNIADEERDYSYPELLEKYLIENLDDKGFEKKIEVYNCGIGGWLSIDILIDFLLNIIHTRPDYIIIYYGYNDLYVHLNEDFALDYSHNRKNLGEFLHIIKRGYYFPKIKFWHSYEFFKDRLFGTGNIRNEVLRKIITKKPNPMYDFKNLDIEKDIIKNILIVCKYHNIRCILSSFIYYDHERTHLSKKFSEGVKKENELFMSLAEEFKTLFVDQTILVPQTDENFLDAVHLTPEGMKLFAKNFGDTIINDLISR